MPHENLICKNVLMRSRLHKPHHSRYLAQKYVQVISILKATLFKCVRYCLIFLQGLKVTVIFSKACWRITSVMCVKQPWFTSPREFLIMRFVKSSFSVSSLSQKGCSHISNTTFYATRGKSMHKESGCTWTTKLKWTWRAKTVEAYWYVTDHTEYACITFMCVLACFNSSFFVLFCYREVCLLRSSVSCAAWCSAPPLWQSRIMRAKFMPRTWEKQILHLLEVSQIQTGICWVWLFTVVGKTSQTHFKLFYFQCPS